MKSSTDLLWVYLALGSFVLVWRLSYVLPHQTESKSRFTIRELRAILTCIALAFAIAAFETSDVLWVRNLNIVPVITLPALTALIAGRRGLLYGAFSGFVWSIAELLLAPKLMASEPFVLVVFGLTFGCALLAVPIQMGWKSQREKKQ